MVATIGNPLSWTARELAAATEHVAEAAETIGSHDIAHTHPHVKTLWPEHIAEALRLGLKDFAAARTDVMALVLLYPAMGLAMTFLALHMKYLHLLFPLIAGFALFAPATAVGLYEISRRREMGEEAGWGAALKVLNAPAFGAILAMAGILAVIFGIWIFAAHWIYVLTLGPELPASLGGFLMDTISTVPGLVMMATGTLAGLALAFVALAISVVSFPMLLDRDVGLPVAITTSVRVFARNPAVVLGWGALMGGLLILGALPMMLGLVVILPVLGHASWHFYRRAVEF